MIIIIVVKSHREEILLNKSDDRDYGCLFFFIHVVSRYRKFDFKRGRELSRWRGSISDFLHVRQSEVQRGVLLRLRPRRLHPVSHTQCTILLLYCCANSALSCEEVYAPSTISISLIQHVIRALIDA